MSNEAYLRRNNNVLQWLALTFFCGCTHFIAAFTKTTPLGKPLQIFSRLLVAVSVRQLSYLLRRRSRQRERLYALMLSICPSVCLLEVIFSKTKQFRNKVSIDDQQIVMGFSKKPILGPLKFAIFKIVKSPYDNEKSSDFYQIYKTWPTR